MSLQYILDNEGKKTGVFVPIKEWKRLEEKFNELKEEEIIDLRREEIAESLKEALDQVQEHRKGKVQLKSARTLLDEL